MPSSGSVTTGSRDGLLFLPSYWASLAHCGQRQKDEYKGMGKVKHKVNKITLPGGSFESRHVRLHRLAGGRRGILIIGVR